MCIICASPRHTQKPSEQAIRTMFARNPDGAGYMYARNGIVHIHKGFMDVESFLDAIRAEHFTPRDAVVYHFRISTQVGANRVNAAMTHPFPLSGKLENMKALDVECKCGVAHNGIIDLTAYEADHEYSDTALFITEYLADIVRKPSDLKNTHVLQLIYQLAGSKFAIMDASGYIATVGSFISEGGNYYSNATYQPFTPRYSYNAAVSF